MVYECTWGGGIDKREELNEVGSTCKQSLNSGKRSPREATTTAGASSATETTTVKSRRWPLSSEERGSSHIASKEEESALGRRREKTGGGASEQLLDEEEKLSTDHGVASLFPPAATSWLSRSHRSIPLTLKSPHIMRLV